MKREKKKIIQIPLTAIRIKKFGLTSKEIQKIKQRLYRKSNLKILKVKIKPVDKREVNG